MAPDPRTMLPGDFSDLDSHRGALYRYALLQVRSPAVAEDLVQATFLAALQSRGDFRAEASLRTWLIAILKRKVYDHFRARERDGPSLEEVAPAGDALADADLVDRLFARNGAWAVPPQAWTDPDAALEHDQFWAVLEACLQAVPGLAGKVFALRELVGLEPDEICKEMNVTKSNYWVLMHRARLRLRHCLDHRWFKGHGG